MIKGSCCCKSVEFELSKQPIVMGTCHCSRCRKIGSSVLVIVEKDSLKINKGLDVIGTYKAKPPFKYDRNFCTLCGTALGEILSAEKSFPISAQCLDNDPIVRNKFHEFVSNKPAWYEICDSAKQFLEHPTNI